MQNCFLRILMPISLFWRCVLNHTSITPQSENLMHWFDPMTITKKRTQIRNLMLYMEQKTLSTQTVKKQISFASISAEYRPIEPAHQDTLRGMLNDGNKCFAISALQVLLRIPAITDAILSAQDTATHTTPERRDLINALAKMAHRLRLQVPVSFDPALMWKSILPSQFLTSHHHDSGEFLWWLLLELNEV
jgi:uncharacterized UBP type Zn finger protein